MNMGVKVDSLLPQECRSDPTINRAFTGHREQITSLCFRSNMTQLASASLDGTVMVWNMKANQRALKFMGHKAAVTAVDFSPSGQILASSSVDRTVRLWTPTVNGDVTVFQAHTSAVRTVQFSNDGFILLSASDDKSIKIWSTQKAKFQATLTGHSNWVRTAKFSPDSRLIVSGSDDKTVKLWDLRQKACVRTYTDHFGSVTSVAFHPSSTVIASASTDKTIKLYDLRTHTLIQNYEDAHKSADSVASGVNSITFGGSYAEWLISTGVDGLVKVWDLKEGHLFYALHGHKGGPTTAACFSPDGGAFATAGSDLKILMWNSNLMVAEEKVNSTTHTVKKVVEVAPMVTQQSEPLSRVPIERVVDTNVKPSQTDANGNEIIDHSENSKAATNNEEGAKVNMGVGKQVKENSEELKLVINQIDLLTQTLSILEGRLTHNEDRTEEMHSKLDYLIQKLAPSA